MNLATMKEEMPNHEPPQYRSKPKRYISGMLPSFLCSLFALAGALILLALMVIMGPAGHLGLPTLGGILAIFMGPVFGVLSLIGLIWGSFVLARLLEYGEYHRRNLTVMAVVLGGLALLLLVWIVVRVLRS